MRLTPTSLPLLVACAAPAVAHASPLYDSFAPNDRLTAIASAVPSPPSPLHSATSGLTILDTAAERAGFSNACFAQRRYRGEGLEVDVANASLFADTDSLEPAGLFNITAIPEPPPLLLLGTGLLFAAGAVWRFGRTKKDGAESQSSPASKSPVQGSN